MTLPTWADITKNAFQDLWQGLIKFLPKFVIALVVLIVGWAIASALGRLAEEIVKRLKIDAVVERMFGKAFKRARMNINTGRWINIIVKVFLLIVTLMAVTDILGLTQVSDFLKKDVVGYIPRIIAAIIILLIGVLVANFLGRMVKAAVAGGRIRSAAFLGGLTKWAILIFALMAALNQLGEQMIPLLVQTLFQGLVWGIALAAGIAFGWGGKEEAARILARIRETVSRGNG